MAEVDKEPIQGFIISLKGMRQWLDERKAMSDISALIQVGLFTTLIVACDFLIDNFRVLERRLP